MFNWQDYFNHTTQSSPTILFMSLMHDNLLTIPSVMMIRPPYLRMISTPLVFSSKTKYK